ncbi:hypothetical protein GDO81_012625 [Engystomops pustulosus]|uniref:Uncharacterized protein n=1 Tax=Engystomops pustulosus TaxID=76066 RepID=A0AAV7B036_ENGPU|nr:hypothetical protein GDO81_012625 [Engystomops pustulosus]
MRASHVPLFVNKEDIFTGLSQSEKVRTTEGTVAISVCWSERACPLTVQRLCQEKGKVISEPSGRQSVGQTDLTKELLWGGCSGGGRWQMKCRRPLARPPLLLCGGGACWGRSYAD